MELIGRNMDCHTQPKNKDDLAKYSETNDIVKIQ
jgi:hypothetical protein